MWITGGIIGGVIAVIFGRLLRPILLLATVLCAYNWWTTDPVEQHHRMELRSREYAAVLDQKRKVLANEFQIVWEKYGRREAVATIHNGANVRISDIALKCSYERPDEDETWKLTTPVASTGFIQPGENKRISFWLRDAASDAIPSSFVCDPVVTLNEADLMRANIVQPKNSGDRLLAQTDISIAARVGNRIKIDRREIIAEGSIRNHSKTTIVTAINLICQGLVDPLGLVRSVGGYTNVYVPPGETQPFSFQVGLLQEMDPRWGIKDLSCRVLTLDAS